VEPKAGTIVTSPVHMKFGSEGIEIAAVPPGDITTARPGIGHYHIGVGVTALRGSQLPPQLQSWVTPTLEGRLAELDFIIGPDIRTWRSSEQRSSRLSMRPPRIAMRWDIWWAIAAFGVER
jgi:hypothetical protein